MNDLIHEQVVQMVNLLKRLPKDQAQFFVTDLKVQLIKERVEVKW